VVPVAVVLLAGSLALGACGMDIRKVSDSPSSTTEATAAPAPTTDEPSPDPTESASVAPTATPTTTATAAPTRKPTPTPSTAAPKPTPPATPTPTAKPTPKEGDTLHPGDGGAYVRSVQQRLSDLGYWLGTPDGSYGYLTSQAVMALQKAAGLGRDGVFGPATRRALESGVRPASRVGGTGVEIDTSRQVLLVVRGGRVSLILNASTGNNQEYEYQGSKRIATTPSGTYSFFRSVDGNDEGPLGDLWRPRYFNGGIAVHGSASVPAYPASHGCARVSNPAMNMIWANGLMPMGSRVVVY
jgi:peptidoglycan hydrolase-like protein with peptidoglycan-binding domain